VLSTTPGNWGLVTPSGDELHALIATAAWTSAPYLSEDWDIAISRVIEEGALDPGYSRYASYTVQLSYEGRTRQYKALFLFGQSSVLPLDHVVGTSALTQIVASPFDPEPLLVEPFRSNRDVRAFVESLWPRPACSREPLTGMCCDARGQCTLSPDVLKKYGFGMHAQQH